MTLRHRLRDRILALTVLGSLCAAACGSDNDNIVKGSAGASSLGGGALTGGKSGTGDIVTTTGGTISAGGAVISSGGTATTSGGATSVTGGTAATGGALPASGGTSSPGSSSPTGGTPSATGGTVNQTGGISATPGGNSTIGGTSSASGATATGGSAATGGSIATGGASASGGFNAIGGASSTGGSAAAIAGATSTGGSSTNCAVLYDFEGTTGTLDDVQDWAADRDIELTTTSTASFTGSQSLMATMPAIAEGSFLSLTVDPTAAANLWPGTVVTFHVMTPPDATNVWLQAFSQFNNWSQIDTAGNSATTVIPGAWTSWNYTVPNTFPGGLQAIGIQIGVGAGGTFAASNVLIDSITACAGPSVCSGNGNGSFSWETPGSVDGWAIDGNSIPADTAIAQSTEMYNAGFGSLKVTLTSLPASASRRIYVYGPNAYCGQVVTYKVYVPNDFGANITLQPFSNINGLVWDAGVAVTPTPGAWNTLSYTLPQISSLGLQRLGLQIASTGTAEPYTGSIYVDDVSWGTASN